MAFQYNPIRTYIAISTFKRANVGDEESSAGKVVLFGCCCFFLVGLFLFVLLCKKDLNSILRKNNNKNLSKSKLHRQSQAMTHACL